MVTAEKKDSQGLCFIGKVSLPDFLKQQLQPNVGNIIQIAEDFYNGKDLPKTLTDKSQKIRYQAKDGKIVGTHNGAHFFTIGQRKGLAVGGTPEPLFVIDTDVVENVVYVGQGKSHPGLFRNALKVNLDDIHWVRQDLSNIQEKNGGYGKNTIPSKPSKSYSFFFIQMPYMYCLINLNLLLLLVSLWLGTKTQSC